MFDQQQNAYPKYNIDTNGHNEIFVPYDGHDVLCPFEIIESRICVCHLEQLRDLYRYIALGEYFSLVFGMTENEIISAKK